MTTMLNKVVNKETSLIERKFAKLGDVSIVELTDTLNIDKNSLVGIDVSDSWVNGKLSKRKPTTLVMAEVLSLTFNEDYQPVVEAKMVPENRLIRMLNGTQKLRAVYQTVKLQGEREINIMLKKPYIDTHKDILYVDFVSPGDDDGQTEAHEMSVEHIQNGIAIDGVTYELAIRSSSAMRTGKAVFIRADYKLSDADLSEFDDELWREFMSEQSGGTLARILASYGAHATEFTNMWDSWMGLDTAPVKTLIPKAMGRYGMSLTSSKAMGSMKILNIGEVRIPWSEQIEEAYAKVFDVVKGKKVRRYKDEDIAKIKEFWNETKIDGSGLIRIESFIKNYQAEFGIKLSKEDAKELLTQNRIAGDKGTLFGVDGKILDACKDPNGNFIYRGYDIIMEACSHKYSPSKYFTGKFTPEFELVALSKESYTSNFSFPFVTAMDGNLSDPKGMIETFKEIVTEHYDNLRYCTTNSTAAKARLGMLAKPASKLEEFGIDQEASSLTSKITKLLNEADEAIGDPYWTKKFLGLFKTMKDDMTAGRIEVKGATRFGITDPTALLRTDLMDADMNIIITDMNQLALGGVVDYYWGGKEGDVAVFRNPMYHPGEAQIGNLVPNREIPEFIKCKGFTIPARYILGNTENIGIFSAYTFHLEALGGADTDGDKFLFVLDERIIALRNSNRKVIFADASNSEAENNMKTVISKESLIRTTIESLRSDNVGVLTNASTTFRDVQQYALWIKNYGGEFPSVIKKELKRLQNEAYKNSTAVWAKDDPTIKRLMDMNISDPMSVFSACDLIVGRFKWLGEKALDTPKTGIYITFGNEDPNVNNNLHLNIKIRPTWLKASGSNVYPSLSTMGQLSLFIEEEWAQLNIDVVESATFMPLLKEISVPNLKEVTKHVKRVSESYQIDVRRLIAFSNSSNMTEEEFNERFSAIANRGHISLVLLSEQYSVDSVALAAYMESYKDAKQFKGGSFLWNCFFEEFLDVVKFYNGFGNRQYTRIYRIHKDISLEYVNVSDGEVSVEDSKAYNVNGLYLGDCSLEDGMYNMTSVNKSFYVSIDYDAPTTEEMSTSLAGSIMKVVGTKYCDNPVAEVGVKFTKADIVAMLTEDNLVRTVATTIINQHGEEVVAVTVNAQVLVGDEIEWVKIGILESADALLCRALNDQLVKVSFHSDEVKGIIPASAVKLVIKSIESDGDLEPEVEVSGSLDTIDNHIYNFTIGDQLIIGNRVFGLDRVPEFRAALWAKYIKGGGDLENVTVSEDDLLVLEPYKVSYEALLASSSVFRAELRGDSPAGLIKVKREEINGFHESAVVQA